jgi:hypothetical protein
VHRDKPGRSTRGANRTGQLLKGGPSRDRHFPCPAASSCRMGRPGSRALRVAARPACGRPVTQAVRSRTRQQPGPGTGLPSCGIAHGPSRWLTPAGCTDKQGSAWLRFVLCEAAQTAKRSPQFTATFQAIARRRGKKIATTAIARKLLTRAWHLLTDAQRAPALQATATAPAPPAPAR